MSSNGYEDFIDLVLHPALVLAGGRVIAANRRLACVTGYSKGELLGMRARDLVAAGELPPDSEPSARRSLTPGDHTGVLVKKDGRRIAAHLVARRLVQGSRSSGMLAVFDKTTEQSPDSICVPDTERLLEQCLRTAEAGVVVIGWNSLVALANRKCCELLGYDDLELIGRPWAGIFTTRRDRHQASEYFNKLVSGKAEPRDRYETAMPTKGGQKRTVSWHHVTLLKGGSGDAMGIISTFQDITEQKKVSKTLEDQERLYRLVSENATAGVWTYDLATGKVTYMSPSLSQRISVRCWVFSPAYLD